MPKTRAGKPPLPPIFARIYQTHLRLTTLGITITEILAAGRATGNAAAIPAREPAGSTILL
jgi:hypothetical protein